MIDLQANLDRQSMANLSTQMDRAVTTLGKTLPQAVQFGAWAVVSTLGTSTRIAPKFRDIVPFAQNVNLGASRKKEQRGETVFQVKPYDGKTYHVMAGSAAAVKQGKGHLAFYSFRNGQWFASQTQAAQPLIRKSGLAKASWGWAQRGLGSGAGAFGGVTVLARQRAANAQVVEKGMQSVSPYIQITNRLGYVTEAMEGGQHAIDNVMERAARRMQHVIDGKVRSAFGI